MQQPIPTQDQTDQPMDKPLEDESKDWYDAVDLIKTTSFFELENTVVLEVWTNSFQ